MSSARPNAKHHLNPIERTDLSVASALALDGRTIAARRIGAIADLGDQPPLRALWALAIVAGLGRRDPKLVRTGLRMLAAHSVATEIKSLIKHRVDRTRPDDAVGNARYRLEEGDTHDGRLSSMPSGHSAGTAAVARAAARNYPAMAPAASVAAASIILAQPPAKNHFVSDLVVGTAIGVVAKAATSALMTAAGNRG